MISIRALPEDYHSTRRPGWNDTRAFIGTNLTEYEILSSCMHVSELSLKD